MVIPLLALGSLGWGEIVVIFLAILLLFGAKRIPELARGLGKSLGEFRKAKEEFDHELHKSTAELHSETPTEKQPPKQA